MWTNLGTDRVLLGNLSQRLETLKTTAEKLLQAAEMFGLVCSELIQDKKLLHSEDDEDEDAEET